jgi:hypothetical protein
LIVEARYDVGHPVNHVVALENRKLLKEVILLDSDVIIKARLQVELAQLLFVEAQNLLVQHQQIVTVERFYET